MSKAQIIEELTRMPREDRDDIRLKLAELDGDDWDDADDPLSAEEKALLASRIAAHERDPGSVISTDEIFRRLEKRRKK